MQQWTFEELIIENEKKALGMQYTIAQRERLKILWKLICEMITADNALTVAQIMSCLDESPSERYQDIFSIIINGGKRNGFFVEFGACDGVAMSNTLILEKYFGWKGILAEPDIYWHESLGKHRSASLDKRCVSDTTGMYLDFFQSDRPGNSSTYKNHPYIGRVTDSFSVSTVTLEDLLKDHDAPSVIDFLTIDTEGHEKAALQNFDFDRFKFNFICVEQHEQLTPEEGVSNILESAGYKAIFVREVGRPIPMQVTGIDIFFVPSDSPFAKY